MRKYTHNKKNGMTLIGLIFILAILGGIAVLGMQVVPSVVEYQSIKKAIAEAKASSTNVNEIRTSFDKQAEVGYITSISGKDLAIAKNGEDVEVSFAYDKKIHLFGPANLLLEYQGTTASDRPRKSPTAGY
jgi:type II secretory pathway pseudopilin PulG